MDTPHTNNPRKHALTIDVEDYYQVAAFNNLVSQNQWENFPSRVEVNTHAFLDLVDSNKVRATFFVLGWIAEKHPALVQEIVARGHEVASHGYSHQLIYTQSPEVFRQETLRSKAILEDITQTSIHGYRAASYSVTEKSLWALDIIAEAGFKYDSSIYPVYHDNYGLRGGPMTPHRIDLANGASMLEFPITTVNILGMDLPVGGGGYFRLYPYSLTRALLHRRNKATGAPFVFYLHPWELDPDQPRMAGAGLRSRFRHYINLDKVATRLQHLLQDFEFTTMADALSSPETYPAHRYA